MLWSMLMEGRERLQRPQKREEGPELKREAEALYAELIERPEITEALAILDRLPEHLRYHVKEHTLDVIRETILFAVADGASGEVIEQQAIAAAFADPVGAPWGKDTIRLRRPTSPSVCQIGSAVHAGVRGADPSG